MFIDEQKVGTLDAQQSRVGYVARLKLLPVDAVLTVIPPDGLPVPGRPLTVSKAGIVVNNTAGPAAGTTLIELVMPPTQAVFEESKLIDLHGVLYSLAIKAVVPASEVLLDWLWRNQFRRWVAIWIDLAGQSYIGGFCDALANPGLLLQYQRNQAQQNTVQIALTGRGLLPAFYLESFQTADLFPDPEFDLSFDFSFTS